MLESVSAEINANDFDLLYEWEDFEEKRSVNNRKILIIIDLYSIYKSYISIKR